MCNNITGSVRKFETIKFIKYLVYVHVVLTGLKYIGIVCPPLRQMSKVKRLDSFNNCFAVVVQLSEMINYVKLQYNLNRSCLLIFKKIEYEQ